MAAQSSGFQEKDGDEDWEDAPGNFQEKAGGLIKERWVSEDQCRWTIFEDIEDELAYHRRRSRALSVFVKAYASLEKERDRFRDAGMGLQEDFERLQEELDQAVGDAAYWQALVEGASSANCTSPGAPSPGAALGGDSPGAASSSSTNSGGVGPLEECGTQAAMSEAETHDGILDSCPLSPESSEESCRSDALPSEEEICDGDTDSPAAAINESASRPAAPSETSDAKAWPQEKHTSPEACLEVTSVATDNPCSQDTSAFFDQLSSLTLTAEEHVWILDRIAALRGKSSSFALHSRDSNPSTGVQETQTLPAPEGHDSQQGNAKMSPLQMLLSRAGKMLRCLVVITVLPLRLVLKLLLAAFPATCLAAVALLASVVLDRHRRGESPQEIMAYLVQLADAAIQSMVANAGAVMFARQDRHATADGNNGGVIDNMPQSSKNSAFQLSGMVFEGWLT